MKNRKAARAMEHLDEGLIAGAMDAADLHGRATHERRKTMKKKWIQWVAIAAVFAIFASVGFVALAPLGAGAETVIALDVNPSIEIEINKNEEIKEVRALNSEAEVVLGDMELTGVDLEVGINAIIGSLLKNGYLSTEQNSILVSVDTKDEATAATLKEKLAAEIDALLGGSNIEASVITQNFDRETEGAKAALISKIVGAGLLDANGVPYVAEVLEKLNVNELKLILESKGLKVEGLETSGSASGGRYITREEALAIAREQAVAAGLSVADILKTEIEMDYDDDYPAMVWEVEFKTAEMKYEYELRATDGEVLDAEVKARSEKDKNEDAEETFAPDEAHIERAAALEIAYAAAGVAAADAKRPEIELEREGGRHVWEVEFKSGGMEYEYTIDAATGEILKEECEPDD